MNQYHKLYTPADSAIVFIDHQPQMLLASKRQGLTNRWSEPLAAVESTFDHMKRFSMFATLAAASGGSARSR